MLTFLKLGENDLEQVLAWRTDSEVTRYMFSDIENDIQAQSEWFRRITAEESSRYWIISYENRKIGVISLNDIDHVNRHTSWGYYIGEPAQRMLGGIIPPYLYNYVFTKMKLRKIIAEVMEGNANLMKLHALHGYREVGVYRDHIWKFGCFHDIHTYELLDDSWHGLRNKYGRYTAEFET